MQKPGIKVKAEVAIPLVGFKYLHFLDVAYGSAREVEYQLGLAHRLGFLSDAAQRDLGARSTETAKVLNGLLRSFRPQ